MVIKFGFVYLVAENLAVDFAVKVIGAVEKNDDNSKSDNNEIYVLQLNKA